MSTAGDRERAIISEARELRDFYQSQGLKPLVRLFAEDYDFLKKRRAIQSSPEFGESIGDLDYVNIIRGPRKRKPRKKRPPDTLFDSRGTKVVK